MNEVFPVVAGALVGVSVARLVAGRLRWLVLVALSLGIGVVASAISGELELSWGFVPVDTAQALVVAVLASAASAAWQRRSLRAG